MRRDVKSKRNACMYVCACAIIFICLFMNRNIKENKNRNRSENRKCNGNTIQRSCRRLSINE